MKLGIGIANLVAAFALAYAVGAQAAAVTNGLTFSIACGDLSGGNPLITCPDFGGHSHSDDRGTPPDFTTGTFNRLVNKAEVGGLGGPDEARGLSEFNLAGMSVVSSATLSFDVFRQGGQFEQPPFTGTIRVDTYVGNNSMSGNGGPFDPLGPLTDYQEPSTGLVGFFAVTGGATPNPEVGDVFTFDVSDLFNQAIAAGHVSLGIRLRQATNRSDLPVFAWTFDDFRLTTYIPEPASLSLLAIALAGLGFTRRKLH